nr:zinc finger, CCHC-type [Tanacetum cinerariifolium]
MAEKDAFLVDYVEGGLCVDYTDARIIGRCNSGSNTNKGKELWDSLESNYMAEDSSSKKFLDFKHTLKHGKDGLSLVQLGSHLRIEESLRVQDSNKGKGKEVGGPFVNMTEEGSKNKHHKQNKVVLVPTRNQSWNVRSVVRLVTSKGIVEVVDAIAWWIDSSATTHVCIDRCWFKTYEPVEDGSVLYMGNDHFAHVHGKGSVALEFSSGKTITLFNVLYVPKLHKNLVSGPMLNKCGYKQVYESDKYILSKSGVFVGFGYYNNESRDTIFDENRFSSIPRPKDIIPNSDESQRDDHSDDVPNEIPEPRKVDKTKKFLSSRFSMKDMGEADVILGIKIKRKIKGIVITQSHYIEKILKKFNREDCSLVSTFMDSVEKLKLNTGKLVDQLEYSRAIGCLMYAMTSTRSDIAYAVGRLSRFTSNPSRQHWKAITRVFNAPTMARAYSQIYNGKSRHLGVRHSMVRELIRNVVISIEFVRTQHNSADHLTKGLARDLVYKSVIGMGLKPFRSTTYEIPNSLIIQR